MKLFIVILSLLFVTGCSTLNYVRKGTGSILKGAGDGAVSAASQAPKKTYSTECNTLGDQTTCYTQ